MDLSKTSINDLKKIVKRRAFTTGFSVTGLAVAAAVATTVPVGGLIVIGPVIYGSMAHLIYKGIETIKEDDSK